MEITKALEILKLHNEWRRDKEVPSTVKMQSPADIGAAIDTVIEAQSELLRQNQEMREALEKTLRYLDCCEEIEVMPEVYFDIKNCLTSLDKGK